MPDSNDSLTKTVNDYLTGHTDISTFSDQLLMMTATEKTAAAQTALRHNNASLSAPVLSVHASQMLSPDYQAAQQTGQPISYAELVRRHEQGKNCNVIARRLFTETTWDDLSLRTFYNNLDHFEQQSGNAQSLKNDPALQALPKVHFLELALLHDVPRGYTPLPASTIRYQDPADGSSKTAFIIDPHPLTSHGSSGLGSTKLEEILGVINGYLMMMMADSDTIHQRSHKTPHLNENTQPGYVYPLPVLRQYAIESVRDFLQKKSLPPLQDSDLPSDDECAETWKQGIANGLFHRAYFGNDFTMRLEDVCYFVSLKEYDEIRVQVDEHLRTLRAKAHQLPVVADFLSTLGQLSNSR